MVSTAARACVVKCRRCDCGKKDARCLYPAPVRTLTPPFLPSLAPFPQHSAHHKASDSSSSADHDWPPSRPRPSGTRRAEKERKNATVKPGSPHRVVTHARGYSLTPSHLDPSAAERKPAECATSTSNLESTINNRRRLHSPLSACVQCPISGLRRRLWHGESRCYSTRFSQIDIDQATHMRSTSDRNNWP